MESDQTILILPGGQGGSIWNDILLGIEEWERITYVKKRGVSGMACMKALTIKMLLTFLKLEDLGGTGHKIMRTRQEGSSAYLGCCHISHHCNKSHWKDLSRSLTLSSYCMFMLSAMWKIDWRDFSSSQYGGQDPLNNPFAVKHLEMLHLKINVS